MKLKCFSPMLFLQASKQYGTKYYKNCVMTVALHK